MSGRVDGTQAPKESVPMKYIFWDARGILAPRRKKCIEDLLWPLKPMLVGFQETKYISFSKNFLKNLMDNRNFEWNYLPYADFVGGILVGGRCRSI